MTLSPLDGRYASKVSELRPILSEYGLIRYRVFVEIRWLLALSQEKALPEIPALSAGAAKKLAHILQSFSPTEAQIIKDIEKITNHDVKAVEYGLQQYCKQDPELSTLIPFIHFACTSEDINNLSYSLMIKEALKTVLLPQLAKMGKHLQNMAVTQSDFAMLSRTHGQAAVPTTLGKEWANFVPRIHSAYRALQHISLCGKMNGAVGNFNAHHAAYPQFNWLVFSRRFIESLGLVVNEYTTQIEPHDTLAELLQILIRLNAIGIDLCRDIWGYISIGYLEQSMTATETGSSTMPHKINPIDFENAEGNLGLANALASHLSQKLPISRWQRDLTDSTVMRNWGCIFGYSLLAYHSLEKGLRKITPNLSVMNHDLNQHWETLSEAIQTTMRRYGIIDAYEQLKAMTRGQSIDKNSLTAFITQLSLPETAKEHLLSLTPENYVGYAPQLAKEIKKLQWD